MDESNMDNVFVNTGKPDEQYSMSLYNGMDKYRKAPRPFTAPTN
jgi:hypothetical protein